ncbi:hypothetical protein [Nonomuraea sp. NPDC003214]
MTGGAVVFDLDGTLVDTMTVVPAAYADTGRSASSPAPRGADLSAGPYPGPVARHPRDVPALL